MLPAIWKAEEEEDHRSAGWKWPFMWICFLWLRIVGCCDHSNGILGPIKGGICLDSVIKVNLFSGRRIIYFSVVTRLRFGWLRDQGPALFSAYQPFLGPIQPPREWLTGPNRPRCEACWPASGGHIMNARRYTFFSPYCMAWCLFQRRDRKLFNP